MAYKPPTIVRFKDTSIIPYCLVYFLIGFQFLGAFQGGITTYRTIIFAFIIIPILDFLIGIDPVNPTKEESKELEKKLGFRIIVWLYVPVQALSIFIHAYAISKRNYSIFELVGLTLSQSLLSGLGINAAHEMIHKHSKYEQFLGKMCLVMSCYGHFFVEHLLGHHKRVATAKDPATARYGETLYQFIPRSIEGSWKSAWELESQRLKKAGLPVWSTENTIVMQYLGTIACTIFLGYLFGISGSIFFIAQGIGAFHFLEIINYIEHYGLERAQNEDGEYTKITPAHSWNSGYKVSNYFLFKLQRHSDHHANAGRRYQILRSFSNSPQLPHGYAGMLLVSLLPPLWFALMDPKVQEYKNYLAKVEGSGENLWADGE